MRTFAIGDVHGHLDLLVDLLARIERMAGGDPHRIICLGDYIDRGPASAGVIAFLRERQALAGRDRFMCLKGNHEDMLLRVRQGTLSEQLWLRNGGRECLVSFGIPSAGDLPEDVADWLAECPTYFEDTWRCYVHAGLDPTRDRLDQRDEDRLWIRGPFLDAEHDFGRYVVHGHTPQEDGRPDLRRHRVNLDTAAAYGGPLTAAMFVDGCERPAAFLAAEPP
ncbi:metallophosphoesterase family protein [Enterovirga sp.]|uniref:metallophosphoesterase family protein n=1 Tax=Enterovirga sp. TaxID=2026350 RepID=UPI002D0D7E0F|nr:metallophosphoesterase family protein [Enterovirga sp.]HMO29274.1 metallophosphoesterase family protein [Enterovirga sp.]